VLRSNGEKDFEPRQFSTWGPKVVALIGELPASLASRAIHIRMQRALPHERLERFRADRTDELVTLACKLARWAADNLDALRDASPAIPEAIYNRDADNWRPLLAIAERAGGRWPEHARRAAMALTDNTNTETLETMLLADVQDAFATTTKEHMPTAELLGHLLAKDDRPWRTMNAGAAITSFDLARMLKPFGIHPRSINTGDGRRPKGYRRADFVQACARYLPAIPDEPDAQAA
jgi:putative DNA primase/helicase